MIIIITIAETTHMVKVSCCLFACKYQIKCISASIPFGAQNIPMQQIYVFGSHEFRFQETSSNTEQESDDQMRKKGYKYVMQTCVTVVICQASGNQLHIALFS